MFTQNNQTIRRIQSILNTYRLPARLHAEQAAEILGFAPHDIAVLVREKLLRPLGKPPANGVKWFASSTIEALSSDLKWLDAASKAVTAHWQHKNSSKCTRDKSSPIAQDPGQMPSPAP